MEMPGMPFAMPATSMKVCVGKGSERDPKATADKNCEVTDVKQSGSKTSWKVRCDNKGEIMTGVGEMSGTADKSEGVIRLTGVSGGTKIDMTQTYSNKRLGGVCDVDELTKKVTAQMCDTTGYDTVQWISGAGRFIKDSNNTCPGKKELLCDAVRKDVPREADMFAFFMHAEKSNGGMIAKACRINTEAITKAMCKTLNGGNVDTLGASCPVEANNYREDERRRACEGRSYTAREDLSRCLAGLEPLPVQASAAESAKPPAQSATDPAVANPAAALIDGAKKLKGLFGF
jgi:hypothetical protein